MRPYGQKRVFGKGLRVSFPGKGKKAKFWMPTKNRKAGRRNTKEG